MKSIQYKLTEAIKQKGIIVLPLGDNEAEFLIKLLDSVHELKELINSYKIISEHYRRMLKDAELLTEISIIKRVEINKTIKYFNDTIKDLEELLKMVE